MPGATKLQPTNALAAVSRFLARPLDEAGTLEDPSHGIVGILHQHILESCRDELPFHREGVAACAVDDGLVLRDVVSYVDFLSSAIPTS